MNTNESISKIYLAGEKAPAGIYRLIEGFREVRLDHEDILPATCDGHVGAYVRCAKTWGELHKEVLG